MVAVINLTYRIHEMNSFDRLGMQINLVVKQQIP
nr:MAG TPA: hypothetical protein [Caudoviricetes sp.]